MLSKGFSATRVDEVCAAAGVTKGSFYHHFESKDELALVLVDRYFTGLTRKLSGGNWSSVVDPTERLLAFLDHAKKVTKGPLLRRGCLLGSFALDLAETHPQVREAIEERFRQLIGVLEPVIDRAMKASRVRSEVKSNNLAQQFVSVLQGSIVLAKAYGDHKQVVEAVRCYDSMLRAVLGK